MFGAEFISMNVGVETLHTIQHNVMMMRIPITINGMVYTIKFEMSTRKQAV